MARIADAMAALGPAALAQMTPAQRAEAYKARAQATLEGNGPAQPITLAKIERRPYLKTADWVEAMVPTTEDYQRARRALGEAMSKQLHEREMARLTDYVTWNGTNTWDYGGSYRRREQHYGPQLTYEDYASSWKSLDTVMKPKEDDDMAKTTPRNLYQYAIVDKTDDSVDIQVLVGETEQDARDELIRNPNVFPDNRRPKEFDIVLLLSKTLSPKAEK